MKPIFKIGDHDYTAFLSKLTPVRNALDADGSGRDILDGRMERSLIAQKKKWTAEFLQLPELIMLSIAADTDCEYVLITHLDPDSNRHVQKEYYSATFNYGDQRYDPGKGFTVYDGCTFDITER